MGTKIVHVLLQFLVQSCQIVSSQDADDCQYCAEGVRSLYKLVGV
jgi:hypothetical protein